MKLTLNKYVVHPEYFQVSKGRLFNRGWFAKTHDADRETLHLISQVAKHKNLKKNKLFCVSNVKEWDKLS